MVEVLEMVLVQSPTQWWALVLVVLVM